MLAVSNITGSGRMTKGTNTLAPPITSKIGATTSIRTIRKVPKFIIDRSYASSISL
jgi:hypothetical protein